MARSSEFLRYQSGSSSEGRRPEGAVGAARQEYDRPPRHRGSSSREEVDWKRIGLLGVGVAAGAILGASAALLLAPHSGEETRELIGDRARRLRGAAGESWDDLRGELRWLARRGRRKFGRGATRGRWAAEDALDRWRE